jgi:hypothetical protein
MLDSFHFKSEWITAKSDINLGKKERGRSFQRKGSLKRPSSGGLPFL